MTINLGQEGIILSGATMQSGTTSFSMGSNTCTYTK